MIEKSGKLYINGKLSKNRYDKNEAYGVEPDMQSVSFYSIIFELIVSNFKLTVSKRMQLRHQKDFMTLAFDPPNEQAEKMNLNSGEVVVNKEAKQEKETPKEAQG